MTAYQVACRLRWRTKHHCIPTWCRSAAAEESPEKRGRIGAGSGPKQATFSTNAVCCYGLYLTAQDDCGSIVATKFLFLSISDAYFF
ncbi:hypothetical protein CCHR01_01093 [Colletotrichum chrysophilum]|uniref:Uncharacterized protein n=1 Tax=Colletotrichum chrysophilum TaxID=1836956 RepID=A0AAD9B0Z2_9PEZI|nr:hypothetical protein CCHR01_01093 [Colletotrichum chrysophilum]